MLLVLTGISVFSDLVFGDERTVNLKDGAFARLHFYLHNTTRENLHLDPASALFRLRLADGKDYVLDHQTILSEDFLAPGPQAAGVTTLIFPVPAGAAWAGSILTISEPGGEPAMLPLSGDMPAAAYPLRLGLPANPQAAAQGLDYQLLSASLDLDWSSRRSE